MDDPTLKDQLLDIFDLLPPRQQRQAVDYVHGLQVVQAPREESEERDVVKTDRLSAKTVGHRLVDE